MKAYRNTLVAILLLTTAGFATSSPVQVCSAGSLSSYVALGATGCSVGSVNFSDFTYSSFASGTGNLVIASDVQVGPINQLGNPGLSFNGNWNAPPDLRVSYGQSDFKLAYTVRINSGVPIQSLDLKFDGWVGGMPSGASVQETTNSGASCGVFASGSRGYVSQSCVSLISSASTLSVVVLGDASNGAGFTQFTNQFDPPPSPTPEPSSILLFGSALGALGFVRRKFVKKQ